MEYSAEGYATTAAAQTAILNTYSKDTWSFLAREERVRLPLLIDLPLHLSEPRSLWAAHGLSAPDYFEQIKNNPNYARLFTYMLYELHQPLSDAVAQNINSTGVNSVLDLGGGSGVISLKLLERSSSLKAIVVDTLQVYTVGREIADMTPHGRRIEYIPLDFELGPLPPGFELVLACDSVDPSKTLFHKIHDILNPGSRFVIVDQYASKENVVPRDRRTWAFRSSLGNPDALWPPKINEVETMIKAAGFRSTVVTPILDDWTMITSWI